MICPVPKLRIELPKQATGGGLPRPPKIETHLTQRLERRRQGRSHVVSLKSRHAKSRRRNRAGVNQENFIGQVFLEWWCCSVQAAVAQSGYRSRRKDKPKKNPRDQSAKMCCHADLRRRKIERCLNRDDHQDICQALFRVRRVTMSQQKSGPRADDAHDAPRRA